MATLLIGLDVAAQLDGCGYAVGLVADGKLEVVTAGLLNGTAPEHGSIQWLASELQRVESALLAIDAPLGWPCTMGPALNEHFAGSSFTVPRSKLFRRRTDDAVWELTEKKPLEVGAEKIAHAAHHALSLLAEVRQLSGKAIPLAWSPVETGVLAIEVYPGATLQSRAAAIRGYKKSNPAGLEARRTISAALANELANLDRFAVGSVDVFDACLCLLAAHDFLDCQCPPPDDIELARKEGWIWVRPISGRT